MAQEDLRCARTHAAETGGPVLVRPARIGARADQAGIVPSEAALPAEEFEPLEARADARDVQDGCEGLNDRGLEDIGRA